MNNWAEDRLAPAVVNKGIRIPRVPEPDLTSVIMSGPKTGCAELLTRIARTVPRSTRDCIADNGSREYQSQYMADFSRKSISVPSYITPRMIDESLLANM